MSDNNIEPQPLADAEKSEPSPVTYSPSGTIMITREPEAGTFRLALRLALGSIILGREELNRRFREKQAQLDQSISPQLTIRSDETDNDRARYAVEGALVHTSESVSHGIQAVGNATNAVFKLASWLVKPVTGSRLMRPVRRQFDRFEARGEKLIQTWIDTGRSEEYLSRALVQDTTTEIIEEVLDYLAVSPEMDQLVEQQTSDMAEDMVEEFQDKTTRIFVFRKWFRRSPSQR
jgi:hypothetical protein